MKRPQLENRLWKCLNNQLGKKPKNPERTKPWHLELMEPEAVEKQLQTWRATSFWYTWMNMDFTVLGRTPRGVRLCTLVVWKERRETGEDKVSGEDRKRRVHRKENWNQGMIRFSLVISLSEAVCTIFFL